MKYIPPASLLLDGYKTSHHEMLPEKTEAIVINMTPRSYKHAEAKLNMNHYDGTFLHFGLQGLIKCWLIDHWNTTFFERPWEEVKVEYKEVLDHFMDSDVNVDNLEALHKLGYLPIEIRGVQEGTFVPMRVPTFMVLPTHKDFAWLPSRLETLLSNEYWKAATIATISHNFRKVAEHYAEMCGAPAWFVDYQCHDFALRGMSGMWDGSNSGLGHHLSFLGSDTLPASWLAKQLYGAVFDQAPVGKTVKATEHMVMTIQGREGEFGIYDRLLDRYSTGILATVSDQYSLWHVLTKFMPQLKDKIMARQGRLVIRPDSGNPPDIICGTAHGIADRFDRKELLNLWHDLNNADEFVVYERSTGIFAKVSAQLTVDDLGSEDAVADVDIHVQQLMDSEVTPEMKGAYHLLYDVFGGTVNSKGYIDLDTHVGLIYGDSIDPKSFSEICERLIAKGFSISNLVVGVGSYCYQFITRDTFGLAIKATFAIVDGVECPMQKDPVTGDGVKKSAVGMLAVRADDQGKLYLQEGLSYPLQDILDGNIDTGLCRSVFRNGQLLIDENWFDICNYVKGTA